MLESTAAYKSAVVGTVRRTYVRAAVGIIDPDIEFTSVDGSAQASYSQPEQIYDTTFDSGDTVMSLGLNRVILDGSFTPLQSDDVRQVGYVGQELSGDDGSFENVQSVTLRFSNVDVLQAITLQFSTKFYDGIPRDFTVTCGSQSWSYTGNKSARVVIEDFTVDSPTAITLQITKWSLPSRRVRIIEIYPGLYEEWTLDDLYALSVTQQANFASTALPYGTCQLSVDNTDRRILTILQENARTPFTEIGRAVGLTSPAVKERVVRMEQAGLIKAYRTEIDYTLLGRQLRALVMLKVKSYDRISERHDVSMVSKIGGVVRAWDVTGDVECIADVAVPTMKELDGVLAKFAALGFATTTYLILDDTGELPALPQESAK